MMTTALDELMMRQAIGAAMVNLGLTRPNPTVGCVIARGDAVIAVVATAPTGRPHAEEQALTAAGDLTAGSTCYVTLEPCAARSSGAASCADRILSAGVAKVFIACEDSSPMAAGLGLQRLREGGVQVEIGLLAAQAEILSAGFRHRLATGRPLVEAAVSPQYFEAQFQPLAQEDLTAALQRYGGQGYSRLWTPSGGELAQRLQTEGLLYRGADEAIR